MNEHILPALTRNKTKSLGGVEPFHRTRFFQEGLFSGDCKAGAAFERQTCSNTDSGYCDPSQP